MKEYEEKLESLAIEKSRMASTVGFHRDQVSLGITKMAQIDGKMELLREMIVEKKKKRKEKKTNDKKPDK